MRLLAVVMLRVRCCGRPIGIEHAAKAVEPAEKVTEVKSKDKNIAAAMEGNNLTVEEKKILRNHTEACLCPFEQVNVKDRHKKSTYNGYFYT
uniref:Uncharacterized protein LOC116938961 isoform X5 n=1 Tax=Petromyzon marinus TaxID=7757 RepID=A0AAJ7SNM2_PETMA|nr:uncharacterized protein LOC116938961 isoform X5 [Petromyzon marinus]